MNQQRKAKLRKRADQQQRSQKRKQELVDKALQHAGLLESFRRIPPSMQKFLRDCVQAAPEIILDASAADCEEARGLQREFLEFLRRPSRLPDCQVTSLEMLAVLNPLKFVTEKSEETTLAKGWDPQAPLNAGLIEFAAQLQTFAAANFQRLETAFISEIWTLTLYNSQFDERILWSKINTQIANQRAFLQVIVHRTKPERRKIVSDGQPRPAFRCCLPVSVHGLNEVVWKGCDIGFPDDEREYPVFMQSHALEQVEKRVPCSKPIFPMVFSLLLPKFLPPSGNRFLIEYHHGPEKLGYFVAERLADCVLLKTFLFLTMQGTPESDLLYLKLRLTRRDIEYMKLDELAAFRDPEVRNDPALVKLLNECGCGHLLKLTAPDMPKEIPTGYADTLRRYLGTLDDASK